MSLYKRLSESFDKRLKSVYESISLTEDEEITVDSEEQKELKRVLFDTYFSLQNRYETNIKAYEVAFQNAIETLYPGKSWWEVTECNIFMDLFETRDPWKTIMNIADKIVVGVDEEETEETVDEVERDAESIEEKLLTEEPVYDMIPQHDARKSFYSKARVDDNGNEKTLYSYNTPVAKIVDGNVSLLPKWDSSATTLRHVKEFLKQNGFEATTLAQMRSKYL
jgi:hypothetical protein